MDDLAGVLLLIFFLFLLVFFFIFTGRVYDFFLILQHDYERLLKGDDVKPRESYFVPRRVGVFVGKVISLLMILFCLFLLWLLSLEW